MVAATVISVKASHSRTEGERKSCLTIAGGAASDLAGCRQPRRLLARLVLPIRMRDRLMLITFFESQIVVTLNHSGLSGSVRGGLAFEGAALPRV